MCRERLHHFKINYYALYLQQLKLHQGLLNYEALIQIRGTDTRKT